jgi:imidazolonepropionase-like amidohydrolase
MRILARLIGVAIAIVVLSTVTADGQAARKLALVGGMLLDGYEVPPVHHAAVLIEGNRITWAGRAAEAQIPPDATVIDTRGRVMMPGLVNVHSHLFLLGHGSYPRWWPWIAEHRLHDQVAAIAAKQLLMSGVTSVIDLGGPLEESIRARDRINRGEIPGPRVWVSGPQIQRGPGGIRPSIWQGPIDTPEDAARVVESHAKAGVDVIKAYTNLTPAHYRAIVQTAHKHNLRVHAHVYDEQDVRNALEAGVDVLQHVGSAGTTPPYSEELIRELVNTGRPVVITAAHRSWLFPATVAFPERLQDPQLAEDFGPQIWPEIQDSLKDWHTLGYFQRTDRELFFREKALGQFVHAGVVMGIGTDGGSPANFHTEATWLEIKAHVDVGMTPQRAISAATRIGARIAGRGQDLGTIEPGKLADIIVLRRNPLFDIMALADVEVVVKDGVVYKGGSGARAASPTAATRQK